jgi:hypothetical protein
MITNNEALLERIKKKPRLLKTRIIRYVSYPLNAITTITNTPNNMIDKAKLVTPFQHRHYGNKVIEGVKNGTIKELSVSKLSDLGRDTRNILEVILFLKEYNVILSIDNIGSTGSIELSIAVGVLNDIYTLNLKRKQEHSVVAKSSIKTRSTKDDSNLKYLYTDEIKFIKANPCLSLRDYSKILDRSVNTIRKIKDKI